MPVVESYGVSSDLRMGAAAPFAAKASPLPSSPAAPSLPSVGLGVPVFRQNALAKSSGVSFREQIAIQTGDRAPMLKGSAGAGAASSGGAPPPPPLPPADDLPAVTVLPPDQPLRVQQPLGGGGGGGSSAPLAESAFVRGEGTPENASAVTASLDIPEWMWVLGAVTFAGVALGSVYLVTRGGSKKR